MVEQYADDSYDPIKDKKVLAIAGRRNDNGSKGEQGGGTAVVEAEDDEDVGDAAADSRPEDFRAAANQDEEEVDQHLPTQEEDVGDVGGDSSPEDFRGAGHAEAEHDIGTQQEETEEETELRDKTPITTETGERMTAQNKFLSAPSEKKAMKRFVQRLSDAADTSITLATIQRSTWDILFHCEEEIVEALERARVTRPLNDKIALTHFERQVSEILHGAERNARPIRYNLEPKKAYASG